MPYSQPWTLTSGDTASDIKVTANPNVTATPRTMLKEELPSLREKIEGVFGHAKGLEGTNVVRNQASLTSYSSASARQTLI